MPFMLISFVTGVCLLASPWGWPAGRYEALLTLALTGGLLAAVSQALPAIGRPPLPVMLVCLTLGYLHGAAAISMVVEGRVPLCADTRVRAFELIILNDPQVTREADTRNARFDAQVVVAGTDTDCPGLNTHRIRLAWYGAPELRRGQRWSAEGKLRPPWGYVNPGGFDYERWLLGQGLHGSGYIRTAHLLETRMGSVADNLRAGLRIRLESGNLHHAGLMLALLIGDDSSISHLQWRWLRDSGTIHLVVVSGLHVGIIVGLLFGATRKLGTLVPYLPLLISLKGLACLVALAGSGIYVALSGFGIPAMRAWLMCAVLLLAVCGGRRGSTLHGFLLVAALTLLIDPLAVHQQGFWLSFCAVLALLIGFAPRIRADAIRDTTPHTLPNRQRRWRAAARIRDLVATQWILLIALSPVLALTQGVVPMISPFINLLVVPVVTLLILPALMLTGLILGLWPGVGLSIAGILDRLLDMLMMMVEAAAGLAPVAVASLQPADWLILVIAALMLIVYPGPKWGMVLASLWVLLLIPAGDPPEFGEFRITALDVGQGSAILVDTAAHRLIYDTGPAYPSGFDMGESAVVPSFRALSGRGLDLLMLSHRDTDHAGGAQSVIGMLDPLSVSASWDTDSRGIDSLDADLDRSVSQRCASGQRWRWDGVDFRVLHPGSGIDAGNQNENDGSCVLEVSAAGGSALLAGDISARVERRLAAALAPVTLVFAPHHGSRTSSSRRFLRATRPTLVFISAPRRSRYGHPHPQVQARYIEAGVRVHVTGRNGALSWHSGEPQAVVRLREAAPYWRNSMD